jgi:hypothetical protein
LNLEHQGDATEETCISEYVSEILDQASLISKCLLSSYIGDFLSTSHCHNFNYDNYDNRTQDFARNLTLLPLLFAEALDNAALEHHEH